MSKRWTRAALMPAVALVVGAATACGAGSSSIAASGGGRSALSSANGAADDGPPVVAPGTPCPMAVHADPMKLAALSQAPVYLPCDGSAQVTEAWRCGDTSAFMFDDVQLSFEDGWENVKIPEKFEDLARDYSGSVETIQGLSAWVSPSSASASSDEVLMVKDGASIRLLARGDVPIGDLVALANSLDLGTRVNG